MTIIDHPLVQNVRANCQRLCIQLDFGTYMYIILADVDPNDLIR